MNKSFFFLIIFFIIFSCQNRYNYITYLNKVNKIDSIYRIDNDTITALTMYQKLFKKYPPHNSYLIKEYETYIFLSDKYNRDFGGKESLYKLIALVAPNWKYNRMDNDFFTLYKKYGIDSIAVESRVGEWKKSLNKILVDSFSTAFFRNQEFRMPKYIERLQTANDKKNAQLIAWTISHYGYPSLQKIGLWGNNDIFMPMGNMLNHMASTNNVLYPYFKEKILHYVKTGECTPDDYAAMIDKRAFIEGRGQEYGTFSNMLISDSVKVNNNRKKIGMPSLKYSRKIYKDYFKD
ncbi:MULTISPECIES: hypothetical protein [Chryseobacterium]|uniref:Uncharacterized protein n=1 Tax=Chryseobacterium camelliae TaxID=1265445 RepID=A0ABU0TNW3_9FLAO|nr:MULTISPECIES: hypothetical protein [Chryseobacterium]MDT3407424.1 hypothetical protein [Pseudacidovorax intermedius]MDQ1098726.1 hypothetical protein [Chryseobacterium camelliae]MDQ1102653.1 hypothetical protein [Chryseobacterium sp. SORGH_AS_1048]MDR6086081.1 hypothetical protein [Chryseobacterium sp. SORGH_AS_0909]MDR6130450.1 hypothetical protein [Chryseobacterium sp. SORGH_AS_1175]